MAVATIIGGAGRMGAWFAGFLKKNGYRIIICDNNSRTARHLARNKGFLFLENPRLAVQPAQLVILATPTNVSKSLLREIERSLPRRSLLVEISSIKKPIVGTLRGMKKRGISILSIHPMFGPGVKSLRGKTVITTLLPRRNNTAIKLLALLRKKGVRIIRSDFAKHDRFASITLALPHFMNIVMVNTLKSCGFAPEQLRKISGTTFKLQLLIAETLYQENFSNEASILMDNTHSLKVLKAFVRQSNRTLSVISGGTRRDLLYNLESGRNFIRKDKMFPRVYGRFNAAIEASTLG